MKKPSTHPEAIQAALRELVSRIGKGQEFPDAAWSVASRRAVDYQALVAAYDDSHATH